MCRSLQDVQLVVQANLYILLVIVGMLSAVPVGITQMHFDGGCLLYAEATGSSVIFIEYGSRSTCTYVISTHVLTSVIYAAVMATGYTFVVISKMKGKDVEVVGGVLFSGVVSVINVCVTLLCFVASCVMSAGFNHWCSSLQEHNPRAECEDFQRGLHSDEVHTKSFHKRYTLASVACWLATLLWLLQTLLIGCSFRKAWRGRNPQGAYSSAPTNAVPSLPTEKF